MRNRIRQSFRDLKRKITEYFTSTRPRVFLLTGENFKVVYAGKDEQNKLYLANLMFGENFTGQELSRIYFPKISGKIRGKFKDVSAIFYEFDKPDVQKFQQAKMLWFPRWVECTLDISKPFSELKSQKAIKDFGRIVRQNNYTCLVSVKKEDFESFYKDFYLPYIKEIHGKKAYFLSYNYYKKLTESSELLVLRQNGETIGGMLFEFRENKAQMGYFGFKNGDCVKDGAASAMYFFSIQRAKEKGFSELSFGPSKSFLTDGILRYKLGKGAKIVDKIFTTDEDLFLEVLDFTEGFKDFLAKNPFVFYRENRKRFVAMFGEASKLTAENLTETLDYFKVNEGSEKLVFFHFDALKNALPDELKGK
ncbi:hypothetical protein IT568_06015, partial [bacterium]|nr:hypothetical protein [bacterium]